jgi:redox-sensitive bicupin YhaK (pirin superfamily)
MKKVIHRSESRGQADHGWLKARHTFSFAGYHNPKRLHFGVLRVLNDDLIAPGGGFDLHPHQNMEIITIPLKGKLEHKDNLGHGSVIKAGDVQVMSAGTGVYHSEFNPDEETILNLLQIWVFPREKNVKPRYQQQNFDIDSQPDKLHQVVSPKPDDDGLWVHQDVWFNLAKASAGKQLTYQLHNPDHGIYIFVIEGEIVTDGEHLKERDAIGIQSLSTVDIEIRKDARVLLMELPV